MSTELEELKEIKVKYESIQEYRSAYYKKHREKYTEKYREKCKKNYETNKVAILEKSKLKRLKLKEQFQK